MLISMLQWVGEVCIEHRLGALLIEPKPWKHRPFYLPFTCTSQRHHQVKKGEQFLAGCVNAKAFTHIYGILTELLRTTMVLGACLRLFNLQLTGRSHE